MKLPSAMIVLFASLLIIGCATKQQQVTPAHNPDPTKKWEKKQNQY
jgi:outer membrane biogenesis lipoprotein LolB